jgi:hypothetical protein
VQAPPGWLVSQLNPSGQSLLELHASPIPWFDRPPPPQPAAASVNPIAPNHGRAIASSNRRRPDDQTAQSGYHAERRALRQGGSRDSKLDLVVAVANTMTPVNDECLDQHLAVASSPPTCGPGSLPLAGVRASIPAVDKRRHRRHEIFATVKLERDQEVLLLAVRDISLGGVFVSRDAADLSRLAVGQTIELALFNTGADEELKVGACVRRHDARSIALTWVHDAPVQRDIARLIERAERA